MFTLKSVLFVLMIGAVLLTVCHAENQLYSDKYDYIDVDAILAVPRQRAQYYKCFIGEGRCLTPDAKFFKGKYLTFLSSFWLEKFFQSIFFIFILMKFEN